jgi:hypothetical protein
MADSKLRMGNVYNSITAGNDVEQARNMGYANLASSIADTLSGKDFQPGMSGFEQVAIGAARGASTGFQNKAAMQKAQAQEEMNAWAKSLADTEAANAASEAKLNKEKAVEQKYASIIASAVIGAQGNPERLKQTLPMYYKMMAKESGYEVVSITPQGENPYVYSVTLRDPEDGSTETQDVNPTALGQYVFEQDQELGKQFVAALGGFDPNKLTTSKKSDGQNKIIEAETALGRALNEQERMNVLGIKTSADKAGWDDRDKAVFKSLNERVEKLANFDDLQALSDTAATKLIDSGLDTGFGTDVLASVAGALGRAFGADNLTQFSGDVSALSSALREQVLPKVKALGAGTGISNADRDYAEKTVGSVNDTVESLIEKMALQRAIAEKGGEVKRLYQDASAGSGEFDGMNPGDANRLLQQKLAEIEARPLGDAKGLKALTARYQAQYLRQLYTKRGILPSGDTALGASMPTQAAPQMDLSTMSDAELEALAGGQ